MAKKPAVSSELVMYMQTTVLGIILAVASFYYISWLKIPNPLNKAFADTSIYLIGFSMALASVCYFWNLFDRFITYRKQLGVVGFVFGLIHIYLSFGVLQKLFMFETWQKAVPWGPFTGAIATVIFFVMTLATPSVVAKKLGGQLWRSILRFGHVAVALIWLHVYFLKFGYILKWYNEGMKTFPSSSAIVLAFMTIVIVLRVALGVALAKKNK